MLLLRAAAAAHNISTETERGTGYCLFLLRLRYYYCCFLCVYSIAVAAVDKGYAFLFFGRGAAAANHFSCWLLLLLLVLVKLTISVLKQRDVPATVSSFYVSVLYCDASDVYCCCCSWLFLSLSFRLRCFGYGC